MINSLKISAIGMVITYRNIPRSYLIIMQHIHSGNENGHGIVHAADVPLMIFSAAGNMVFFCVLREALCGACINQ